MEMEQKIIKAKTKKNEYITTIVSVHAVAPNKVDSVLLEVLVNDTIYSKVEYDLFTALQKIRLELEMQDLQVLCNGAAKNVYPSPMQFQMARGRLAYLNHMGCPAKDIVDIFEYDESLEFVSVHKQKEFQKQWMDSVLSR